MNKSDLMSRINKVSRQQNNRFDISCGRRFTAPVGALLPVYTRELPFGTHISLNLSSFTRTVPMQKANFARMREEFDVFFVPFRLIFEGAQAMLAGSPHVSSSRNPVPKEVPSFSYHDFEETLNRDFLNIKDDVGIPYQNGSKRLLYQLGYGSLTEHGNNDEPVFVPSKREDVYQPTASNNSHNNVFVGAGPQTLKVSALPLAAYQKIYQDYYRNKFWENENKASYFLSNGPTAGLAFDMSDAMSNGLTELQYSCFDKDRIFGMIPDFDGVFSMGVNSINIGAMTSNSEQLGDKLSPDPNVSVAVNSLLGTVISTDGLQGDDLTTFTDILSGKPADTVSVKAAALSAFRNLSALALRRMEALQRFAEITSLNKDDYKHQMQALFGKPVNDLNSDYCTYLGGMTQTVNISDVEQTAPATSNATGKSQLGDLAGRGTSFGAGAKVDFTAPEHGYLMIIYHIQPQIDYLANHIDPQLQRFGRYDFLIPQFGDLGFEPVRLGNICDIYDTFDVSKDGNCTNPQLTVGWLPRYFNYKTDIDTCSGAFVQDPSINGVRSYVISYDFKKYLLRIGYKASNGNPIDYRFFKVYPSIVDNLFYIKNDGTTKTDEFISSLQVNAIVDLPLSVDGLPY